jgi:hypothetical protein
MKNTKKIKRLRKRTIGGGKTFSRGKTGKTPYRTHRKEFLKFAAASKSALMLNPDNPSLSGHLSAISAIPHKSYIGRHIASFMGPNETALKDELLDFASNFPNNQDEKVVITGNNNAVMHGVTSEQMGKFVSGEIKRRFALSFKVIFKFEECKVVFTFIGMPANNVNFSTLENLLESFTTLQ